MIDANIKYVNSDGVTLDLSGFPYKIKVEELFDWAWEATMTDISSTRSNVNTFRRTSKSISTKVWFCATGADQISDLVNHFFEVTEVDVVKKTAGKLIINNQDYIECFITAGSNRKWQKTPAFDSRNITILFPHPFWINEQTQSYQPNASVIDIDEGDTIALLGYPYQYNYGYDIEVVEGDSGDSGALIRMWEFDGIANAPFVLSIYGAVVNPRVNIDGHLYQVNVSLQEDDKVVIDSRDKTVKLYRYASQGGNVINAYMYQNFDSDIFKEIPCGRMVQVSSVARFTLTVYSERSEPQWI